MSVKAKCPECGDEEGYDAKSLQECIDEPDNNTIRGEWFCMECKTTSGVVDWKVEVELTLIHPNSIEAIARRVVELMKESG